MMAPLPSAPTVTVFVPLVENTPLAPLAGALNVTGIPAAALVTGQPSLLLSATCSPVANALCRIAVCGVPATSVIWFGGLDDGQFDVPVPVGSVGDPPVSPAANAGPPASMPTAVPKLAATSSPSPAQRTRRGNHVIPAISALLPLRWCHSRCVRRAPGLGGGGGRRGRGRG